MTKNNRVRITNKAVEQLVRGETLWDSVVQGFGVRCQAKARVFVLKVRIRNRQRWLTIGNYGAPWTADKARKEAQRLWGDIRAGKDLAAIRDADRHQPTMVDLCQRFLDEHAYVHKKPSSINADVRNINNHIIPLIGKKFVVDVTRKDMEYVKRKVRDGHTARPVRKKKSGPSGRGVLGGPGAANHVLCCLSKMFNLAEQWEIRPLNSNPCRHVQKFPGRKMERFLSTEEIHRLGATLEEMEKEGSITAFAAGAIRLLLFTGARLREILDLKWSEVDFERRLLVLPDSKTGARYITLNQPCIDVLTSLPRLHNNPHVIPGTEPGKAMRHLQSPWDRLRRRCNLQDVRIHDLRHSFASHALLQGGTLPIIGKLLGHKTPLTTARYAHLAMHPLADLSEATGGALSKAMRPDKLAFSKNGFSSMDTQQQYKV